MGEDFENTGLLCLVLRIQCGVAAGENGWKLLKGRVLAIRFSRRPKQRTAHRHSDTARSCSNSMIHKSQSEKQLSVYQQKKGKLVVAELSPKSECSSVTCHRVG